VTVNVYQNGKFLGKHCYGTFSIVKITTINIEIQAILSILARCSNTASFWCPKMDASMQPSQRTGTWWSTKYQLTLSCGILTYRVSMCVFLIECNFETGFIRSTLLVFTIAILKMLTICRLCCFCHFI